MNKKILCLLLVLIFSAFTGSAYAANPYMIIPHTMAIEGDTFDVEITLTDANEILGFDFNMTFDPAYLEVVDADEDQDGIQITVGPFIQGLVGKNQADNANGTVRLAAAKGDPGVTGNGVIAVIRFKALQGGNSHLIFSSAQLIDQNLNWITASSGLYQISIIGHGTVTGKATLQGRNLHSDIQIMDQDQTYTAYTDEEGNFSIELPPGTYTFYAKTTGYISAKLGGVFIIKPGESITLPNTLLLAGDANGDDEINILDLAILAQQYDTTGTQSSDYNNDGKVDLFDLVLIAKNYNKKGDMLN